MMIRFLWLLAAAALLCGCSKNQELELAKARAEAEAARAELAKVQAAAAPPANARRKISGELFATTKGGDVKKGAGVVIHLIPVTSTERELVADTIGRLNALKAESRRFQERLNQKYPHRSNYEIALKSPLKEEVAAQQAAARIETEEFQEKHGRQREQEIERALGNLRARGERTMANSDGQFEFDVSPGEYLLITDQKSFGQEKLVWLRQVDAREKDVSLSLDQTSAVFGFYLGTVEAQDVKARNVFEALAPLMLAGLQARVAEAERKEAESLAQAIAANPVRDARPASPPPAVEPEPAPPEPVPAEPAPVTLTEEEKRMQVIFRDWAKQRGAALKRAAKMQKSAAEAYIRRIDQGLVKSLTKKYDITHEELDRILAYGAKHDWWERE